jgi:steroid 5-alpha reductase family enzyme
VIPPLLQILIGLLFVVVLMSLLWLVQRTTRNAGIVDVAWAGSVGVLGVFFAATGAGDVNRRLVAGLLIGIWSLRLTVYLFHRVVGHPEEGRYATLRAQWGDNADSRLFRFFQMQAAAALVFALPLVVISSNSAPLSPITAGISLAIWTIGMSGIYLADVQLERFKSDPDNVGRTCRTGLWRYSRHPNYFFEWIHWWAYLPLALLAPFWWIALVIPLLLLYFVLFVTGIPPTEAQAVASRGEDYRRYQRTTSAFVPWFPRKDPS